MNIIKYILGGFLILSGLGFMFNGSFLGGLLISLAGLAVLPPVAEKNKEKYPFWRKAIIRRSALIFITLVGFGVAGVQTQDTNLLNESETASSNPRDKKPKIINLNNTYYDANGNKVEPTEIETNTVTSKVNKTNKIDLSKIDWTSSFNPSKIKGDWYQIIWFNPNSKDDKTYINDDNEEQLKLTLIEGTYQTSSIAMGENTKFNYHIKNNRIIVTVKSKVSSEIFNYKIQISKDNNLMKFTGKYEVKVYKRK